MACSFDSCLLLQTPYQKLFLLLASFQYYKLLGAIDSFFSSYKVLEILVP